MGDSQPSLSRQHDLYHATPAIPFDLIVEIFSFLPGKSLIRFQSLSKLWLSIIRSKQFADSFLTKSKSRPRLLLPFRHLESVKLFILSAPEHNNNEDDKASSTVISRHDMTISDFNYIMSPPVNGLFCCFHGYSNSIVVCNPTTRQIVKLPDLPPKGILNRLNLGYDPVEDQYKVFCVMTEFNSFPGQQHIELHEYFVCTVRSCPKQKWRKIENTTGHNNLKAFEGICIGGAIYYGAGKSMIVRLDVRSEKMKLIKEPKESDFSTTFPPTLLNYNGKLGGVDYANRKDIRLWILEDAEKQEWSSMTFVLPSELERLLGVYKMSKGEVHTGELMVFHPWLMSSTTSLCVWYYDFKKESIRKVEIKLDGDFIGNHGIGMLSYPGYFENIRLLHVRTFFFIIIYGFISFFHSI